MFPSNITWTALGELVQCEGDLFNVFSLSLEDFVGLYRHDFCPLAGHENALLTRVAFKLFDIVKNKLLG